MYKSTFMGLNTALRGVLAHQNSLDVTGHNLANIETEGYTRQRAQLTTSPQWSTAAFNSQVAPGQMGTGVEVTYLERLRDQYIDTNVRQQLGREGTQQALVEQLQQVESAFQEPGTNGISARMREFWSAMDAVSTNPDSLDARTVLAQKTEALTQAFRQLDADLVNVRNQSDARLTDTVGEVNAIAARIATLNTEIGRAVQRGQQPNDLLDSRDQLMDDLSKIVNFTSSTNANGQVTITMGATFGNLVDPAATGGMVAIARADLDAMYVNGEMNGGRAFADMQLWDPAGAAGTAGAGIIDTIRGQLDSFVSEFVGAMNAANAAGFDLAGAAGGNIFAAAGTTAATFAIDPANSIITNPGRFAASALIGPGQEGNGGNVRTMLDTVRGAAHALLGGQSFEGFYAGVVSGLGTRSEGAQRDLANAEVLADMAIGRRTQVSGVSLDEEMSNMLRFQHAYNASARVLTTMDEALDTIINRMGRVGL